MSTVDPWAWAGLLKWSLNYVDGTNDTSSVSPMSEEDKAFLEKVMKEGIIDENERMKFILQEFSKAMEYYHQIQQASSSSSTLSSSSDTTNPISEDDLEELLQELRDIVEQIDYARAFCSLKGLAVLLGCIQQVTAVPESIRISCLGILSTLCQNNPPVQEELLELGALKILCDLFFAATTSMASMKAKIMLAISSIVRNHPLAESVFCQLPQSPTLIRNGLEPLLPQSQALNRTTLFFLRALLTSDDATPERVQIFAQDIVFVMDHYLLSMENQESKNNNDDNNNNNNDQLIEMAVSFLEQLLETKRGVHIVLEKKNALKKVASQRISMLQSLTGDEKEFGQLELEHWENFLKLLERAEREESSASASVSSSSSLTQNGAEPTLMLKM